MLFLGGGGALVGSKTDFNQPCEQNGDCAELLDCLHGLIGDQDGGADDRNHDL
jgi:hypothetical protein